MKGEWKIYGRRARAEEEAWQTALFVSLGVGVVLVATSFLIILAGF